MTSDLHLPSGVRLSDLDSEDDELVELCTLLRGVSVRPPAAPPPPPPPPPPPLNPSRFVEAKPPPAPRAAERRRLYMTMVGPGEWIARACERGGVVSRLTLKDLGVFVVLDDGTVCEADLVNRENANRKLIASWPRNGLGQSIWTEGD